MPVKYADNKCIECGRRITILAPQYDATKPAQSKTGQSIGYDELQIKYAKRCRVCAHRIARTAVDAMNLQERGDDE